MACTPGTNTYSLISPNYSAPRHFYSLYNHISLYAYTPRYQASSYFPFSSTKKRAFYFQRYLSFYLLYNYQKIDHICGLGLGSGFYSMYFLAF